MVRKGRRPQQDGGGAAAGAAAPEESLPSPPPSVDGSRRSSRNSGGRNRCYSFASSDQAGMPSSEFLRAKEKKEAMDEAEEVRNIAKKETRGVRVWRLVVISMILVAGAAVSGGTYLFLQKDMEDDYIKDYDKFENTIRDTTHFHVEMILESVRTLGRAITGHAIASDSQFPEVTLPMFEVHGAHFRRQSGIKSISYMPLVYDQNRDSWEEYSVANQGWLEESIEVSVNGTTLYASGSIVPYIHLINPGLDGKPVRSPGPGPYTPFWQLSPPPVRPQVINYDPMFDREDQIISGELGNLYRAIKVTNEAVFSRAHNILSPEQDDVPYPKFVPIEEDEDDTTGNNNDDEPHSALVHPVFTDLDETSTEIGGLLVCLLPWNRYVANLLPRGVNGIVAVLRNSCGQAFTYEVNGNNATYLGTGDRHDPNYDSLEVVIPFNDYLNPDITPKTGGHCEYALFVYPSAAFEESYDSNLAPIVTSVVAISFFLMAVAFLLYDLFVTKRNDKVVNAAANSNRIVSSLFPSIVRTRMFNDNNNNNNNNYKKSNGTNNKGGKNKVPHKKKRSLRDMNDDPDAVDGDMYESKPIADLYPETTIMFSDIAGFTAWSSAREPTQVFILLETLYGAFDEIAKRRGVYKVETVGDCYVAVCGLPEPNKDHALVMCRFALDCMMRAQMLTKKLELTLGPDTGDLAMRTGLHSGAVTAGVLRGDRSRFQLFGDTMNTAARMESNGLKTKIHLSRETAELLISAGKGHWVRPREETIVAKGKGELQTYWLVSRDDRGGNRDSQTSTGSVVSDSMLSRSNSMEHCIPEELAIPASKTTRLIEWSSEILGRLLKILVARRQALGVQEEGVPVASDLDCGLSVLDEVHEILVLDKNFVMDANANSVELEPAVVAQLHKYVSSIAQQYGNTNAFHNFEHAAHVSMSIQKLLARIITPRSEYEFAPSDGRSRRKSKSAVDPSFGIASDPMVRFACTFACMIHDVYHPGVTNAQLVREGTNLANGDSKSIAEQESFSLAWKLLCEDDYKDLRNAIFATEAEKQHFRAILVNCVMATDILDRGLNQLRQARWNQAFTEAANNDSAEDTVNRKATVVIEYLIQAADVAHTMQHWHIYRKWNERLFMENKKAFARGRADKDPAEYWYHGELAFFDFYVIPLANKLNHCGIFGLSGDEYSTYATKNRNEWERRGIEIVSEMQAKAGGSDLGQSTNALSPF